MKRFGTCNNELKIENLKSGDKVIRVMYLGQKYSFIEVTVNRALKTKCETNTGIEHRDVNNEISTWDKYGELKCTHASRLNPYIIPHCEENIEWMNSMISHNEKKAAIAKARAYCKDNIDRISRDSEKWLEMEKFFEKLNSM